MTLVGKYKDVNSINSDIVSLFLVILGGLEFG